MNALVGFAVGYGVILGSKRGGIVPAVIGGVLAFAAMMCCELFLLSDALTKFAAAQAVARPPLSPGLFLGYLQHKDLIDWLFIAIGVYGGVRTPLRATTRRV